MDAEPENPVPTVVNGFAAAGDPLTARLDTCAVWVQPFGNQALLYGDVVYFRVCSPCVGIVLGNVSVYGDIFIERPAYRNVVDHDVVDVTESVTLRRDGIERDVHLAASGATMSAAPDSQVANHHIVSANAEHLSATLGCALERNTAARRSLTGDGKIRMPDIDTRFKLECTSNLEHDNPTAWRRLPSIQY